MIRESRLEKGLPPTRKLSKKMIKTTGIISSSSVPSKVQHDGLQPSHPLPLHKIKQEMTTNSSRALLLIHDTSRTHLSKRLEREADKIDMMMKDLTDYVQENSRQRFKKNFQSQQNNQERVFLDQEIKSEDEGGDDTYGMTKLLKRINVNKSSQ